MQPDAAGKTLMSRQRYEKQYEMYHGKTYREYISGKKKPMAYWGAYEGRTDPLVKQNDPKNDVTKGYLTR